MIRTHRYRGTISIGLIAAGLLALPMSASALSFSGIDAQTQYTGFPAPIGETAGLLTFNDTVNGTNPNPEPGVVTDDNGDATLPPIGSVIDLEILLDTSGYDPATDSLISATFIGTGGNEVVVWDSTKTTVLLAFDVSFVDVVTGNGLGSSNTIQMGDPEGSAVSGNSLLTITGGSLAAGLNIPGCPTCGGVGSTALLELIIEDPDPPLPGGFGPGAFPSYAGFLEDSFTSGVAGASAPEAGVNWAITIIPEPGTAALVALGLAGLGLRTRRRAA